MSKKIEIEVGDLYSELHSGFCDDLGQQYEEQARQKFEQFLHEFNQQIERQMEQAEKSNQMTSDSEEG